jgi:hypothetical protein
VSWGRGAGRAHEGLARRLRVRSTARGCCEGRGVCGHMRGWRGGVGCMVVRGVDGRVGAVERSR